MKIKIIGILFGVILFITGILLSAKFEYKYSRYISIAGALIASASISNLKKLKKQPTSSN